jgi:hypothetical protein
MTELWTVFMNLAGIILKTLLFEIDKCFMIVCLVY